MHIDKWAFVPMGFCPGGLLSQWAFILVGFCPTLWQGGGSDEHPESPLGLPLQFGLRSEIKLFVTTYMRNNNVSENTLHV